MQSHPNLLPAVTLSTVILPGAVAIAHSSVFAADMVTRPLRHETRTRQPGIFGKLCISPPSCTQG